MIPLHSVYLSITASIPFHLRCFTDLQRPNFQLSTRNIAEAVQTPTEEETDTKVRRICPLLVFPVSPSRHREPSMPHIPATQNDRKSAKHMVFFRDSSFVHCSSSLGCLSLSLHELRVVVSHHADAENQTRFFCSQLLSHLSSPNTCIHNLPSPSHRALASSCESEFPNILFRPTPRPP